VYTPAHFAETRLDVMQALVRAYPLATLVTCGGDGLRADPVPMLWLPDPAPHGRLIGHVARANPVATDIDLNIERSLSSTAPRPTLRRPGTRPRPNTAARCRPGITPPFTPAAPCA